MPRRSLVIGQSMLLFWVCSLATGCGATSWRTSPGDDAELEAITASDQPAHATKTPHRRPWRSSALMDDPDFTPDEVALASAEEAVDDRHSQGGEPAAALETDRSAAADVPRNACTVEQVETDSFASEVLDSDRPVLVDFYADWCGPCKQLAPVLDDLAADTPDVKVVKVNIDASRQLAKTYQVRSVPTLMVFKQGEMVAHHRGAANRKKVEELLAR